MAGFSDQEQELLRDPEGIRKEIARLRKQMLKHAENLEFEAAAGLRDRIKRLEEVELGF